MDFNIVLQTIDKDKLVKKLQKFNDLFKAFTDKVGLDIKIYPLSTGFFSFFSRTMT